MPLLKKYNEIDVQKFKFGKIPAKPEDGKLFVDILYNEGETPQQLYIQTPRLVLKEGFSVTVYGKAIYNIVLESPNTAKAQEFYTLLLEIERQIGEKMKRVLEKHTEFAESLGILNTDTFLETMRSSVKLPKQFDDPHTLQCKVYTTKPPECKMCCNIQTAAGKIIKPEELEISVPHKHALFVIQPKTFWKSSLESAGDAWGISWVLQRVMIVD